MMTNREDHGIGLALGGGGVLGAAHIGVLRAIEEQGLAVSHIAGTSIGAFIAAFYAFGKSWQEIEAIVKDLNWLDASELSLSRFGILSNQKLGEILAEHIGEKDFGQARIPLAVVATDIFSGDRVVLQEGSVARGVMASTCVPGVFNPVSWNERLLVDGGIVENVPVTTLREMGAEILVGVALGTGSTREPPENILDVLLRSFYFTIESATRAQTKDAHLLIKPDLAFANLISTDQVEALMARGHLEAQQVLSGSEDSSDNRQ